MKPKLCSLLLTCVFVESHLFAQSVNRYTDSVFLTANNSATPGECLVSSPYPPYNATICQGYTAAVSQATVKLLIDRVVGATDSTGALADPDGLVSKGVVGRCMDLRIIFSPAYRPAQGGGAFHHSVSINEFSLGEFEDRPSDSARDVTSPPFCVPVAKLKFGILQTSAGPPIPGVNTLTVTSNFAELPPDPVINEGPFRLNASLTIDALYPVVPVHGWNADSSWFERALTGSPLTFRDVLANAGLLLNEAHQGIDLGRQVLIEQGARVLQSKLNENVLIRFGVNHAHFVAHSKGGLYTRKLLKEAAAGPLLDGQGQSYNLGAFSLTTLDTPHHGNAGADYIFPILYGLIPFEYLLHRHIGAGLRDLSIARVQLFNLHTGRAPNQFVLPVSIGGPEFVDVNTASYYSTASNADINGNHILDTAAGIQEWAPFPLLLANAAYLITGSVINIPFRIAQVIPANANWVIEKNDVAVTVTSARYNGFTPLLESSSPIFLKNHTTLAKPSVATEVIGQAIKASQPLLHS